MITTYQLSEGLDSQLPLPFCHSVAKCVAMQTLLKLWSLWQLHIWMFNETYSFFLGFSLYLIYNCLIPQLTDGTQGSCECVFPLMQWLWTITDQVFFSTPRKHISSIFSLLKNQDTHKLKHKGGFCVHCCALPLQKILTLLAPRSQKSPWLWQIFTFILCITKITEMLSLLKVSSQFIVSRVPWPYDSKTSPNNFPGTP